MDNNVVARIIQICHFDNLITMFTIESRVKWQKYSTNFLIFVTLPQNEIILREKVKGDIVNKTQLFEFVDAN